MNPSSAQPQPKIHAVVPCAGAGTRAGRVGPKQYELLAGKTVVERSVFALLAVPSIAHVHVVLSPQDQEFALLGLANDRLSAVPCGGASRAETVANALQHLLANGALLSDWALVHDAARCLATPAQITALIEACRNDAVGGLLAVPLADTLKAARGSEPARSQTTLDRADKWLAQTPQMFRIGVLRDALAMAAGQVTDEASAIEALGLEPLLALGSSHNFKITFPQDFEFAAAVIAMREHT